MRLRGTQGIHSLRFRENPGGQFRLLRQARLNFGPARGRQFTVKESADFVF
jgi:hypothetical protein